VAGKLEVLPVKVGRSNEDWIEILEGLAVGQQVSLLRP
jgi:multidrug efflux pump subunit AcrA (membrane-fusion protein)